MQLELDTWLLAARWGGSAGTALALTALALRSQRVLALAAGSAVGAAGCAVLALVARGRELNDFPIGSTADFCLGLAAVWLLLAAGAGWSRRTGALRAAALVLGAGCAPAVLSLGYFVAHKPGYDSYSPSMRSVWLPVHALAWTLGLGLVVFAAATRLLARSRATRS